MNEIQAIPEHVSAREVADQLKVSEQYARQLIRSGILQGQRVGKQWVVAQQVLTNYLGSELRDVIDPVDRPRPKAKLPKFKALSFFSGAMGFDIGLEKAGIRALLACEIDKASRRTIVANRPDIALIGDIWKYTASDIRHAAGLSGQDDIDLIVGGPPCQAFSTAGGRQGFKDERGNAFLRYIDLLLELKPKYAVIENVRGLLSAPMQHRPHAERGDGNSPLDTTELPGGALLHVLGILRKAGYGVSFNLYNSANFGAPQVRERVVMICHRSGKKVPYLSPTHCDDDSYNLPKWRMLREVISDLPEKQTHLEFPEKRLRFYRMLKPGQYWKHLPTVEMQKEALGNSFYAGGGKTGFFRRLAWDRPSPTLVTHPAMPATDLAHPEKDRPLSIEEYKRIQEFPDDWKICGSLIDQYRQVGNAVPISLGKAIGLAIISHSQKAKSVDTINFQYSRYKFTDDVSWENQVRMNLKQHISNGKRAANQLSLFAS